MGVRGWLRCRRAENDALDVARRLNVFTGFNVRELGGYAIDGGCTCYRRFLRSGALDTLSRKDQLRLHDYGVRKVVDLRGEHEVLVSPDNLEHMHNTRSLHVPLYDVNLSDPALEHNDEDYWALGYLTMLANHDAIRRIFSFFSMAKPNECVLYHCAAGMDRTGVVSMLLLGLCGASRERICADYLYSFASESEVDGIVFGSHPMQGRELPLRMEAVTCVLDRIQEGYGSAEAYLLACGLTPAQLAAIRSHLCEE